MCESKQKEKLYSQINEESNRVVLSSDPETREKQTITVNEAFKKYGYFLNANIADLIMRQEERAPITKWHDDILLDIDECYGSLLKTLRYQIEIELRKINK